MDRGREVRMVTNAVGIIGAGLIGLATARQLARSGVPVIVWASALDIPVPEPVAP
jgi:2-polyprenyl-6-methoxyphenol hydroxylase-like FAD-dependent oxidoreductase